MANNGKKVIPGWKQDVKDAIFCWFAYNATDLFNDSWQQAEVCIMLFVEAVEVNALAEGALRRVTQWPWIEHPTFRLRGGHSKDAIQSKKVAYKNWLQNKAEFSMQCAKAPKLRPWDKIKTAILGEYRTQTRFQLQASQQGVVANRPAFFTAKDFMSLDPSKTKMVF